LYDRQRLASASRIADAAQALSIKRPAVEKADAGIAPSVAKLTQLCKIRLSEWLLGPPIKKIKLGAVLEADVPPMRQSRPGP